ncbi:4-amino-4-deoxy-L-arabinose transferase-like glycosyltransferase of PMT family [Thermocrinis albus DSM 14484]|uniref:4-amino-4-deoxy-L-arabinose transferase-like glycosyltransferase of PMT family n=1 Tax=Thermocrinis albus (strain DSM 14484 / JCM 11386 / HI 11/12) TaxID=638303 RepID=D3SLM1_THEAH|nr:glycosyltransferase family 39 protein [Thermocrinis albus]ADC89651.1 4-amino-4-deoxy-L-arabinose transferase-like glycosyltransferase of PMT family [Thermocrinis albus DSM 14484]
MHTLSLSKGLVFLFFVLAFLSLLPNLNTYALRNEESRRLEIAFEMYSSGNYMQPTFMGELYFNKPPLFNWLIIFASNLVGWGELTPRVVSVFFLFLTCLSTGFFTYYLFRKLDLSLLASLVFLTFGNVLFFYGYLGEIDMTFTFFVSAFIFILYVSLDKPYLFPLAGFLGGLSFLLKGFPAFGFFFLTLFSLLLQRKDLRPAISLWSFSAYFLLFVIPFLWLFATPYPTKYLTALISESSSRFEAQRSLLHYASFFLIFFKDLLPHSLLLLVALITLFKKKELSLPHTISSLLYVLFFNLLPYLIALSGGRYLLPLYPIMAVVVSYYYQIALEKGRFAKLFYVSMVFVIFLRLAYGLFYFPYYSSRDESEKVIAYKLYKAIPSSTEVACECPQRHGVCAYISLMTGKPTKRIIYVPNAKAVIVCPEGKPSLLLR